MNLFEIFRSGAAVLVTETMAFTDIHRLHGLNEEDWALLTSPRPWNIEDRMRVRSIISEVVNISLTIAGLPAQALPAQYVAAVLAYVVAPANLLVAATRAPDTFDGISAAGIDTDYEIKPVTKEQMQSLVLSYASREFREPAGLRMPRSLQDESTKESAKK